MENILTHSFNPVQLLLSILGYLAPIPLSVLALHLWHHYRQEEFMTKLKWTLLEIHVPRDVVKSPAAMELIFNNAFGHKTRGDFWGKYIIGVVPAWFSLEIISRGGNVHFLIRVQTAMRDLVENQIYAQYPQAKVIEVADYVYDIPTLTDDSEWDVWACEYTKEKEDFYPIKTYNDFGEDLRTGIKEEFKIDPITSTIEYMGSLPKGQELWMQIVIRDGEKKYHSHKKNAHVGFYQASAEFMNDLIQKYADEGKTEANPKPRAQALPEPLKSTVEAINRQINKSHFDVGIRVVTLSNKKLCSGQQFGNLVRDSRLIFNQYSQKNINSLKRVNATGFDMPWNDPTGQGIIKYKNRSLDFYRLRTFFNPPLQYSTDHPKIIQAFFPTGSPKPFVFSSEELATLFHFPGMVSETPTFKRIESKIAKPPANLPI